MERKIHRLPALKGITGKSRTAIYNDMKCNLFPQSVAIGKRAIGWRSEDIERWLSEREVKPRAARGESESA